jgi:phosphoadenosine phosphosulfate reductase
MRKEELIRHIDSLSFQESLEVLANLFPGSVVFSSSLGQEDQVITDMILKNRIPIKIFTIDTGRLFNETYELLEKINARHTANISVYFPEAVSVEQFVNTKGINSFYESVENRKECCHIRKVEPLNRALTGAKVWITGLRAEQSANRKNLPIIEWIEEKELYKFNPLINWSYEDVMDYLKKFDVPYNVLHDKGFLSIGCAPCTRAIQPGEYPRAGRWWWEASQKECGLHQTVIK